MRKRRYIVRNGRAVQVTRLSWKVFMATSIYREIRKQDLAMASTRRH